MIIEKLTEKSTIRQKNKNHTINNSVVFMQSYHVVFLMVAPSRLSPLRSVSITAPRKSAPSNLASISLGLKNYLNNKRISSLTLLSSCSFHSCCVITLGTSTSVE